MKIQPTAPKCSHMGKAFVVSNSLATFSAMEKVILWFSTQCTHWKGECWAASTPSHGWDVWRRFSTHCHSLSPTADPCLAAGGALCNGTRGVFYPLGNTFRKSLLFPRAMATSEAELHCFSQRNPSNRLIFYFSLVISYAHILAVDPYMSPHKSAPWPPTGMGAQGIPASTNLSQSSSCLCTKEPKVKWGLSPHRPVMGDSHPQQLDSHQTQGDHVGLGALNKVRSRSTHLPHPSRRHVGGCLSNFQVTQRSTASERHIPAHASSTKAPELRLLPIPPRHSAAKYALG